MIKHQQLLLSFIAKPKWSRRENICSVGLILLKERKICIVSVLGLNYPHISSSKHSVNILRGFFNARHYLWLKVWKDPFILKLPVLLIYQKLSKERKIKEEGKSKQFSVSGNRDYKTAFHAGHELCLQISSTVFTNVMSQCSQWKNFTCRDLAIFEVSVPEHQFLNTNDLNTHQKKKRKIAKPKTKYHH